MMKNIKSIKELRRDIYHNVRERRPYVFKAWKWYSYRKFKARLYIEGASIFAYVFLKISTPPNVITLIYLLMGLFGGILLALPSKACIILALVFFYFRGIFDWTDGTVARMTNQASINGTVMDSYGALVGWVSLWTGLGFYLGHFTSSIFYYLSPVIPALLAADLYANARETIIYHHLLGSPKNVNKKEAAPGKAEETRIRKIKNFIGRIFEHNARTVDLIVLMVLIEILTAVRIVWIFYSAFLAWQVMIFAVRLLIISRGGWAEREIEDLRKNIYE